MRASTEVALRTLPAADADNRALMDDVLQETDHMTRLVEDLLLLSRLDAPPETGQQAGASAGDAHEGAEAGKQSGR